MHKLKIYKISAFLVSFHRLMQKIIKINQNTRILSINSSYNVFRYIFYVHNNLGLDFMTEIQLYKKPFSMKILKSVMSVLYT